MTNAFNSFLQGINQHLDDFNPEDTREYIEDFWQVHQDELEYGVPYVAGRSENTIVSDFWELADRYNESQAIVDSDPYCINAEQFKNECSRMLEAYTR